MRGGMQINYVRLLGGWECLWKCLLVCVALSDCEDALVAYQRWRGRLR